MKSSPVGLPQPASATETAPRTSALRTKRSNMRAPCLWADVTPTSKDFYSVTKGRIYVSKQTSNRSQSIFLLNQILIRHPQVAGVVPRLHARRRRLKAFTGTLPLAHAKLFKEPACNTHPSSCILFPKQSTIHLRGDSMARYSRRDF